MSLNEALPDLVAVEGVIHVEGCMSLVVVVVVVGDAVTSSSLGLLVRLPVAMMLFSSSLGRGAWSLASDKSRALIDCPDTKSNFSINLSINP